MGRKGWQSVAVIGAGPAGTTLAALLARSGIEVALYAPERPRGLVVGESLLPAVVPVLQELGVEDAVRRESVYKPGATFTVRSDDTLQLQFSRFSSRVPGYAYNVPRDRFDAILLEASRSSGARIVEAAARVEREPGGEAEPDANGIRLDAATLTAGGFTHGRPDLVVDASGRSRLLARLLGLPTRASPRRDAALFADLSGVPVEHEGHVYTDRLASGWCWRIPLPGRVSLGIVVDPAVLRRFGPRAEEQYEGFLGEEPHLQGLIRGARRLTPVVRYDNYQLSTHVGVGPGWALVGDALGFVDPVFSSGLLLAMDGASSLASAILSGESSALRRYERRQLLHIAAWHELVDIFYDGRFFELLRMSGHPRAGLGRMVRSHLSQHLPRLFTGEATLHRYDRWLLDFVMRHAVRQPDGGYAEIA